MDPRRPDLLDGLDDAQREAVTADAPVLRILAGAGSGKTRVLTRRIAHRAATGDADPRRTLALTFTRRAADELETRLGRLGIHDAPTAGTFHAIALSQLRTWWADRGAPVPRLVQHKPSFLRRLLADGEQGLAVAVAAEVDWAAARLVTADRYEATVARLGRRGPLAPERMATVIDRYQQEKRRKGVVDFDDLLDLCTRALVSDRSFGDAQRWRFRHLFVDEFQDLNPLQFRLLRAWLPPDGEPDLCVVGDPNQAIYAWNGADNRYLERFDELFPAARTVRLDRNYRSSPLVVATAAAVLGPAATQRAVRPPGPVPTVAGHADEHAEAAAVVTAVREAARTPGRRWDAQAVLVRTHAQAVILAAALEEAGVPVRMRTRPERVEAEPSGRGEHARAGADERGASLPPGGAPVDRSGGPAGEPAVDLATFHAAKGLEWPVVHVAGVEDGLVPHASATTPDARDEERRLLYVALTRAERELHLTWARRRSFRGRTHDRRPSPWLTPVEHLVGSLGGAPGPASGGTSGAPTAPAPQPHPRRDARRTEAAATPTILDELRGWRDTRARASRVAPQVVLSDAALELVAAAAPSTVDELAGVAGVGPIRARRYGDALLAIVAGAAPAAASTSPPP